MVEELTFELLDVRYLCETLQVSCSGFYAWLKRPTSKRKTEDAHLWQKIKRHWDGSRKTYGRRRIQKSLINEGEVIGKVHRHSGTHFQQEHLQLD